MPDCWNACCQGNSTKAEAISTTITCLFLRLDFVVDGKTLSSDMHLSREQMALGLQG